MDPVKILLVEDHADTRKVLSMILRKNGFHVAEAGTVADAIAKLDGQAFALLDYNLPDGHGTTVCKVIRRQPHKTKVAFITAVFEPLKTITDAGSRPDIVFPKPFDLAALLKWLRDQT